jgi:hypothetical protein
MTSLFDLWEFNQSIPGLCSGPPPPLIQLQELDLFSCIIIDTAGKGAFFVGRKVASSVILPILPITNLTLLSSSKASAPIRIKKLRLQIQGGTARE